MVTLHFGQYCSLNTNLVTWVPTMFSSGGARKRRPCWRALPLCALKTADSVRSWLQFAIKSMPAKKINMVQHWLLGAPKWLRVKQRFGGGLKAIALRLLSFFPSLDMECHASKVAMHEETDWFPGVPRSISRRSRRRKWSLKRNKARRCFGQGVLRFCRSAHDTFCCENSRSCGVCFINTLHLAFEGLRCGA